MKSNRSVYLKNFLLPCFFYSTAAGVATGGLIFLFKLCANLVIEASGKLYAFVRGNPVWLPLLLLGAAGVGLLASLILRKVPDCRGGGIPTAIAILRGLISFHWLKSIIFVFFSALLTYLCGVPLGNEGPSVQMGTAVGRGIVQKNPAWNRYIMTGGASAGFAAATGAPLTGIFFAFEEAHRRFSPMLFLVASITAMASSITMKALCSLTHMSYSLFHFAEEAVLPMRYYWITVLIGILVGLAAWVFTKGYRIIRHFVRHTLKKLPFTLKIVTIFTLVSLIGFFSAECIGSGHGLVDAIMEGHSTWYLLIVYFLVRALLLLVANNADITGGLFVPTLAFGAILGGLCGTALVQTGVLPAEYYGIMVVTGIVSFLGASSRTPLMALTFALEAMGGLSNLLPIGIGVTIAFLTIENLGIPAFSDTVIESKTEAAHHGKKHQIIDLRMTVMENSFVVGKEIRDILWPPACMILSVHKPESTDRTETHGMTGMGAGDVLHIHYQTWDNEETVAALEDLVGRQDHTLHPLVHLPEKNHNIPET